MQAVERTTVPLEADLSLVVESLDLGEGQSSAHAWLLHEGMAVAYLSYLLDVTSAHPLLLCDIEVRCAERGKGWSKQIVRRVEQFTGHTMYSSGNYTTLGYQRMRGRLPLLPGRTGELSEPPQSFVANWKRCVSRHRL